MKRSSWIVENLSKRVYEYSRELRDIARDHKAILEAKRDFLKFDYTNETSDGEKNFYWGYDREWLFHQVLVTEKKPHTWNCYYNYFMKHEGIVGGLPDFSITGGPTIGLKHRPDQLGWGKKEIEDLQIYAPFERRWDGDVCFYTLQIIGERWRGEE